MSVVVEAVTNGGQDVQEEGDATHQKVIEQQEQSIGPLREDLAEWIAKTLVFKECFFFNAKKGYTTDVDELAFIMRSLNYSPTLEEVNSYFQKYFKEIDITADTFMDVLDNGVYICDLVKVIQKKAEESVQQGVCNDKLPDVRLRCNRRATSGSWFARDNAANFANWCKACGIQDDSLFESEDLVSHKNERQVIVTLLELARLGYRYGLEPPSIIKIEKELEREETPMEQSPPPKPKVVTSARSRPLNLDEEVRKVAAKCRCSDDVKRIREGTYLVFGKVVIIRLLKNRHLMVRVGGGWETFEHYLIHHNPVLVVEHKRRNSIDFLSGEDVVKDKFLYVKGKYKK